MNKSSNKQPKIYLKNVNKIVSISIAFYCYCCFMKNVFFVIYKAFPIDINTTCKKMKKNYNLHRFINLPTTFPRKKSRKTMMKSQKLKKSRNGLIWLHFFIFARRVKLFL